MIISEKRVSTVAILGTVERAKALIYRELRSAGRIPVGLFGEGEGGGSGIICNFEVD